MSNVGLIGFLAILAIFATILSSIAELDDLCVKNGGRMVVVSEKQAKGTFNHTECKYEK